MSSGAVSTRDGASRRVGRLERSRLSTSDSVGPTASIVVRASSRNGPRRRNVVSRSGAAPASVRASGRAEIASVPSFASVVRARSVVSGRRSSAASSAGRCSAVVRSVVSSEVTRCPSSAWWAAASPVTASASSTRLRSAAFCERTSASASFAAARPGRSWRIASLRSSPRRSSPLPSSIRISFRPWRDGLVEAVEQVVEARRDERALRVDHPVAQRLVRLARLERHVAVAGDVLLADRGRGVGARRRRALRSAPSRPARCPGR